MVESVHAYASATTATTIPPEEQRSLAGAVRATFRNQVIDLLRRRGLMAGSDLLECPKCSDRVIVLDQPATFVYDRDDKVRICSACGAERDFIHMFRPEADIGGEGG